jgi:hypothetical protein
MDPIEPHHTLYFYADGNDLHDDAALLLARFEEFVRGRTWTAGDVCVVDQIHDDDPTLQPGDLPDWDLGLNLRLSALRHDRPAGWFDDVIVIVSFLRTLSDATGRAFVIGAAFASSQVSEDLFEVSSDPVDLESLKVCLAGPSDVDVASE